MESIPENIMEAAEIRNTAPITGFGIPARIYALFGHKPYNRTKTPAYWVTRLDATPVAATMPIFCV